MPHSYTKFKNEISVFLNTHFTNNNITKILDVGPGAGVYASLLPMYKLDAVEIYEPYIHEFNLLVKYNKVFVSDILNFDFSTYEFLIIGDVLEHINTSESKKLLKKIKEQNIQCLIAVPYNYVQGIVNNNIYEVHKQDDLTPEVMHERYPMLNYIFGDSIYGYYVNF